MAEFLGVKNYEKHQHYKDKDPVWIKFYVAVLSDPVIVRLPDAAQCQLFKFWALASRHENRIPNDLIYLKQQIKPRGRFYLNELIASGFLYKSEEDSRKTLDESSALNARGRALAEEVRGKRLETASTAGRDLLLDALTPTRRRGMEAALAIWAEGHDLPPGIGIPTPSAIDSACRDVVASCEPGTITPRVVRGFIARAMRPEPKNGASKHAVTPTRDEGYHDAL